MNWIKAHKIWTAIIIVVILGIIGAASGGNKNKPTIKSSSQPSKTASTNKATTQNAPAEQTQVAYQTVVNKDTGSQITIVGVIDPSINNSSHMPALCSQLHSMAAQSSSKYFFADFYDSMSAATNRDKVINDTASSSETADYDQHYVLTYKHNPSTNYNQCTITYQGDNDPNPQIIKY